MSKELPTLKAVPAHIPEELIPVYDWWITRGPKTVAIVIVILAIVFGVIGWHLRGLAKLDQANVALAQAQGAEDFQTLLSDNNTKPAQLSRLALARAYYNAGSYQEALSEYNLFLAQTDAPEFKDIAVIGKAHALEGLGQADDAIAILKPFAEQATDSHYLKATALIAWARCETLSGNKAQALTILAPVLTADDKSPLAAFKFAAEQAAKMIESYEKPQPVNPKVVTSQTAPAKSTTPAKPAK